MDATPIFVLLIEDDPDDALLIQRLLSKDVKVPFGVKHADRIREGLEHLRNGEIDIVLLDFGLPDG